MRVIVSTYFINVTLLLLFVHLGAISIGEKLLRNERQCSSACGASDILRSYSTMYDRTAAHGPEFPLKQVSNLKTTNPCLLPSTIFPLLSVHIRSNFSFIHHLLDMFQNINYSIQVHTLANVAQKGLLHIVRKLVLR